MGSFADVYESLKDTYDYSQVTTVGSIVDILDDSFTLKYLGLNQSDVDKLLDSDLFADVSAIKQLSTGNEIVEEHVNNRLRRYNINTPSQYNTLFVDEILANSKKLALANAKVVWFNILNDYRVKI